MRCQLLLAPNAERERRRLACTKQRDALADAMGVLEGLDAELNGQAGGVDRDGDDSLYGA